MSASSIMTAQEGAGNASSTAALGQVHLPPALPHTVLHEALLHLEVHLADSLIMTLTVSDSPRHDCRDCQSDAAGELVHPDRCAPGRQAVARSDTPAAAELCQRAGGRACVKACVRGTATAPPGRGCAAGLRQGGVDVI